MITGWSSHQMFIVSFILGFIMVHMFQIYTNILYIHYHETFSVHHLSYNDFITLNRKLQFIYNDNTHGSDFSVLINMHGTDLTHIQLKQNHKMLCITIVY